jgi:hypothetical protein
MTTAAKVIIIVGICVVLGVLAIVAAGVYWLSRHGGEVVSAVDTSVKQGAEFGRKTDNQGCVDEALSRYRQSQGFNGGVAAGIFLATCLDKSRPTPGFCDEVPRPTDFMKSAAWQIRKCKEAGLPDPYCRQLYSQVEQYCERERMKNSK